MQVKVTYEPYCAATASMEVAKTVTLMAIETKSKHAVSCNHITDHVIMKLTKRFINSWCIMRKKIVAFVTC